MSAVSYKPPTWNGPEAERDPLRDLFRTTWGRSVSIMDVDLQMRLFKPGEDAYGQFLLAEVKHGQSTVTTGPRLSLEQMDRLMREGDPECVEYGGCHLLRFKDVRRKDTHDEDTQVIVNETHSMTMRELRYEWTTNSSMNVTPQGLLIKPFNWSSR